MNTCRIAVSDIEAAPLRADVLRSENGVLANHFDSWPPAALKDLGVNLPPNSYPRLARMGDLAAPGHGQSEKTCLERVLRDRADGPDSICRHEAGLGNREGERLTTDGLPRVSENAGVERPQAKATVAL